MNATIAKRANQAALSYTGHESSLASHYALQDHVGWSGKAHVVGFSMGGMIACKLAATAPDRVASLTLLGVTGGGTQIIPLSWSALKIAATGLVDKSVHGRAYVDVKFHFSHSLRRSMVSPLPL